MALSVDETYTYLSVICVITGRILIDIRNFRSTMSRFSRAKKVHGQTVEGRRAVLESLRAGRDIERL